MNEVTEDDLLIIDLNEKTDLLSINLECPICSEKYYYGVPYVSVPCNKCGQTYKTDLKQSIYDKFAKRIIAGLSYHEGVMLRATERYETDINLIEKHFKLQCCWEIEEMEKTEEQYRFCDNCGVCLNCFTCKNCGKTFERDINRRKQHCPHCKSESFTKTRFTNPFQNEKNKHIRLCPHCKSDRIKMTVTKNKTKCHECNSEKLSEPRINVLYILKIKRKKAYRKDKNK